MSTISVQIPTTDRGVEPHTLHPYAGYPTTSRPFETRLILAAPHVVADVLAEYTPGVRPPVDWEATIAFRRHLWSFGIGVAEGMDTSERGPGGLDWSQARELIARSQQAADEAGGLIVCGAGTDQLDPGKVSLQSVTEAYLEQLEYVESVGGSAVIRASHALCKVASGPEDYLLVYGAVLRAANRPAIVHWLGTVFDPTLAGYWGFDEPAAAMEVVLEMARENAPQLRGIKFSLLDAPLESQLRTLLPAGVGVFTGDDYRYPELILGDGEHHSNGLLGVFDPLAPIASAAQQQLELGDDAGYLRLMKSTVPLAIRMFEEPAASYKTGTVFLAWLSGHQGHFRMVSGREGMRSVRHLTDVFVLADELGLFPEPELTASRMRTFLAMSGIE